MQSKIPSKNELQAFYDKNITANEIAKIYDVKIGSIYRWAKELGCVSSKATYKYEQNRYISFSQKQKEYLVGTILGDACLANRSSGSVRFTVTHCDVQKDLTIFARAILKDFVPGSIRRAIKIKKDGSKTDHWVVTSIVHNYLKELRTIFYPNNIKIVPDLDFMRTYFSDFSLANLIMDDGWRNKDRQMGLSSESFFEEGNIRLRNIIKELFDVDGSVRKYHRRDKDYWYLFFNVYNAKKLSEIIEPHMLDCMKYKLVHLDK